MVSAEGTVVAFGGTAASVRAKAVMAMMSFMVIAVVGL